MSDDKCFILADTLIFCNITRAAIYVIDLKCESEAHDVFASMTLAEVSGQFLTGSMKLARYHDLTSGNGIALVEANNPSLVIEFVNECSQLCKSVSTPIVNYG